ncbi:MAG: hypothetical protein GWN07_35160, partial [Actinobacteria bacterium]|nr:hypothetical protein [Actinomycetota bacterium]NIS36082.1 hypothetical protein [Actinomycetota bacterium]NIU70657.1 hypothetical protein [Actinomycetota bacterium]NIW32560.1 hypothetical protein [Actinomycetota bacterium]NIX24764.1 hypothetical protein [Actinomycetota bacterium]
MDTIGVDGLGLAWTELLEQCTRQDESSVSLWWALGVPSGDGEVTAHFDAIADNASIVVTRYSGVDAAEPFGPGPAWVAGNANGLDGACSGGVDTDVYALPMATTRYASVVVGAIASPTRHTEGDGWTEVTERRTGSGPLQAGLAIVEREVPVPSPLRVEGELSDEVDWAASAVELHRQQFM